MATSYASAVSTPPSADNTKFVISKEQQRRQSRRLEQQSQETQEFLNDVIDKTLRSRALRTRDTAKVMLQAISGYGYSIQLQLRLFVIQLIVLFAQINTGSGDISVFGGFVRELVREKHQPGTGYFESDLDINIAYECLREMLTFLRRCNLDIKLESFNRKLLSIAIQFQNSDQTYKVPVDFVTGMKPTIDFDVNNLSMRLSHQFDMSKLVSSDIDTIGELLLPKVAWDDSLPFEVYVKGSIQAIIRCVATLEYGEGGRLSRYRSDVYRLPEWTRFNDKMWLCRVPKLLARGFKVDMEQIPVFHTQAELDAQTPDTEDPTRCPYCLDNDDKDQVFVTLACCGNKVHASCHFENILTTRHTIESLECCMCRQSNGIQMQNTATDFLTSSDEFEKLMIAVEDMHASVRVQSTPRRSAASERVRQIREQYRRLGTEEYL